MNEVIAERQTKQKEELLEQFKKTPIIQYACEKVGVSRATYYRWRKEDKDFAEKSDTAITDGSELINDMAESQLISAIRNQNMTGIMFWLKHHHPAYKTRIELDMEQKPREELTPQEKDVVLKALQLASIAKEQNINFGNDDHTGTTIN